MSLFRRAMSALRRDGVIGSDAPDAIYLGRYRDPVTNERGARIQMAGSELVVLIGRNRSGKDIGVAMPNALQRRGLSTVWWDTRGEAAAISLPYRRTLGPAWIDNAFGELVNIPGYADLRSDRLNLLKSPFLDPANPLCFDYVCALVEAMIPAEGDRNPFFPMSAQALYGFITKEELTEAKGRRDPSLVRVRMKATEADEFDPVTGELVKGIRAQARRVMAGTDWQSQSLAGDFAGEATDGIRDVVATGAAHTKWALSSAIAENEKSALIDLAQIRACPDFALRLPAAQHGENSRGLSQDDCDSNIAAVVFGAEQGACLSVAERIRGYGSGAGDRQCVRSCSRERCGHSARRSGTKLVHSPNTIKSCGRRSPGRPEQLCCVVALRTSSRPTTSRPEVEK